MRAIGDKALERGPASLGLAERLAAYHSLVWLSVGGLPLGMVYSARENLLLLLPGPGERVWQSDFPASAALVRESIERTLAKKAPAADEYRLQWPGYCADRCDVAFALNGGWLKVVTAGGTGRCTARAGTHVRYGRQFRASTLFGIRGYFLRIDQAPYWALQELGWLHPYRAVYEWDCRPRA